MIGDKGVAFVYFVGAVVFENARGASRKSAHVQRQHDVLRDDFALAIQYRAARVLRLADDRRVAGAEERVLHFLHDAGKTRLDDLQGYGIDAGIVPQRFELLERLNDWSTRRTRRTVPNVQRSSVESVMISPLMIIFRYSSTVGLLLGMNHRGGVQLLDDRRAVSWWPGSSRSRL